MSTTASPDDPDRTILAGNPWAGTSSVQDHALSAGTLLDEYEILERVSESGFSIVYRAFDRTLHRQVAVKEYLPSALAARAAGSTVSVIDEACAAGFAKGLASFVNEARLLARFDHPSLLQVYRVWEANGTAYIVAPFYEGVTLKARLKARGAPPDETWLRKLLEPLLEALATLHAGQCLHRDIAPDNILILENDLPLLLDFGATPRVVEESTQALTVILKSGYAPIEQYAESGSVRQGPWTDIYAIAGVIRFAITGRSPTSSVARAMSDSLVPLSRLAAGRYSEAFLRAIDRALAVQPEDRPQDVDELRSLLGLQRAMPPTQPMRDSARAAHSGQPAATKPHEAATAQAIAGKVPARAFDARRVIVRVAAAALIAGPGLAYLWYRHNELPALDTRAPSSAPTQTVRPQTAPREAASRARPEEFRPAPSASPSQTTIIPTTPAQPAPTIQPPIETGQPQPSPPAIVDRPDAETKAAPAHATKESRVGASASGKPASDQASDREWPEHCTDIVQRASLGEKLTDDEQAILRRDCK